MPSRRQVEIRNSPFALVWLATAMAIGSAARVVSAQERWLLVQKDNGQTVYVDTATIQLGTDSATYLAWFKFTFDQPQTRSGLTFTIMMVRADVDCVRRSHLLRQVAIYDSLGAAVASSQAPLGQWMDLVPGSSGETAMLAPCGLLRHGKRRRGRRWCASTARNVVPRRAWYRAILNGDGRPRLHVRSGV
jgi:hypothetical protein